MAGIEPISSVMTYQAQTINKPQTVEQVNTEVPEDGYNYNVDETTASVSRTQAEDEKNSSDNNNNKNGQNQGTQQNQAMSESLKKAIAEMNEKINNSNQEAIFGVHEETNRVMIKIVDKETKEVVKEFPPEKTLDMIAKVWEVAGILVDEKR